MPILLIDSYDSFTFNLRSLIESSTGQHVITVHNDALSQHDLERFLPLFDAVVVGPGPGHPSNASDVGIIPLLFSGDLPVLPVLGICLGFQSLCLSQGSPVEPIDQVKHGQVYKITHSSSQLFEGTPQGFDAVRYHSLCVPQLSSTLIETAHTSETDGTHIVMAVQHTEKPWSGVQYHPESICSAHGDTLIKNFMKQAHSFNSSRHILHDDALLNELISTVETHPLLKNGNPPSNYKLKKEHIPSSRTSLEICDILSKQDREFILLNSASAPGQWSIIGLPSESSLRVTHSTETPHTITLKQNGKTSTEDITSIWEYIAAHMNQVLQEDCSGLPFIGGFMGLFSYEEGHNIKLNKLPKLTTTPIPDTKLVFIEQCILVDNLTRTAFITSLTDDAFIQQMKPIVTLPKTSTYTLEFPDFIDTHYINRPDEKKYTELFHQCQSFLKSGDSYELCLTVPTKIGIPSHIEPWTIYKTLTSRNPSPYSAFFKFDDCALLSSSPERFVSWDKDFCQLRPIKGTVKKSPEMTREKATEILNTPKELGENLMIVDLIRHDLFELLNKVEVTKLMSVEEYKTVFQLVSVIEGHFKGTQFSGIDVLSRSLPPGSMTGAPKKRSVEILQDLENNRRGLYSGVCGYWSIEDKADWSVIIRSLFHYKQDIDNTEETNLWRIGAGGAITVLSDAQGEWQEMLTKLDSALGIFLHPQ